MKYDFSLENWASNNSLTKIIQRLRKNTDVLEFGCANGRLTKYMKENLECNVTIVEIDEEAGKEASAYAKESLLGEVDGNIENFIWCAKLEGIKFDYIIFADVLEHLRDPEIVLKVCKSFLNENGSIIVSIPNIANNSIIASLYKNEFEYQEIGLLDNTHIKFYTYNTFKRMLGRLDYKMVYETGTFNKIGENEIPVTFVELPKNIRKSMIERSFGDVYQFIFEFKNMNINDECIYNFESRFPQNATSYYESVYYLIKQGNISESNKFSFPVKKGINHNFIQIASEGKIDAIRFDPINCNCIMNWLSFSINGENVALDTKASNASIIDKNVYLFQNDDPFIEFKIPTCQDLIIDFEFEILEFDYDVNEGLQKLFTLAEGHVISLQEVIKNSQEAISALHNEINRYKTELDEIKIQRKEDLENFEIQSDMLKKNGEDIQRLNQLVNDLNKVIEDKAFIIEGNEAEIHKQAEIIQEKNNKINEYNTKFYHFKKIK